MAQPISPHIVRTDPASDIRARLERATLEHADALLSCYALLQELHDNGVLEFLRGFTGAGGDIVTRLSELGNTPEAIAGVRNLISLGRIMGAVDPDLLHRFAGEWTKSSVPQAHPPGFWTTLRWLTGKDSRRALGAAAYGIQTFGRVLISRQLEKD